MGIIKQLNIPIMINLPVKQGKYYFPKSLVGKVIPHRAGKCYVTEHLKRGFWRRDCKTNKAVKDVVYAFNWNNNPLHIPITKRTPNYESFLDRFELVNSSRILDKTDTCGNYDESLAYGYETYSGDYNFHIILTESIAIYTFEDYKISFTPWHDGVWLSHITVNKDKRGQRIGTEVMNAIYDISEYLNIPIYLNPYPAEDFNPAEEKTLVQNLEKWYRDLGFGPAPESDSNCWPKVWSNFE